MTGTVKVDTAKLTSTANSFRETGNQIRNLTNQMTTLVNSLTGAIWSGDAANAYKSKFNGLQDDIVRMLNMINEHVTDLNTMAQGYANADTQSVGATNDLAMDVIV